MDAVVDPEVFDFEIEGFRVRAALGDLPTDIDFVLPPITPAGIVPSGIARDLPGMSSHWLATVRCLHPAGFPDSWDDDEGRSAILVKTGLNIGVLDGFSLEFRLAREIVEAAARYELRKRKLI